jgi:hypothetical protein
MDFIESAEGVAPVGKTRLRRSGGVLQVSTDGGAYGQIGTTFVPASKVTTLGAPASSITVSGIDPATDGDYDIYGNINISSAGTTVKLQPNALDTNARNISGDFFNGGVRSQVDWRLAQAAQNPLQFANGTVLEFSGRLFAKTGKIRYLDLTWYMNSGGASDNAGYWRCWWNDTSTALASLVLVATAGQFGTGSFIRLTAVAEPA